MVYKRIKIEVILMNQGFQINLGPVNVEIIQVVWNVHLKNVMKIYYF